MNVIDVAGLTYRYGRHEALRDLDLVIPQGALYALLGPNGAGKTTLLQVLMGLRRADAGRVSVLGTSVSSLSLAQRASLGYVADGQDLPGWMRIGQMMDYLAPLYPSWDRALERELTSRFGLDPRRKVKTLSRGEKMKVSLLAALAPRPMLLLMDEPFNGMDVSVKDELVSGLLGSAGQEGWTVVISSHDVGELELLADWVGFLEQGAMRISMPMDELRARFKRVDATLPESVPAAGDWMSVERAGEHLSFVMDARPEELQSRLAAELPGATRVDVRDVTLREAFLALRRGVGVTA